MLRKREYRDFSAAFHEAHSAEPIVVQIELTYTCPLKCVHCYSDCYNNKEFRKRELETKDVKKIIDKLYDAKCLWLCFTGGDPLMRKDFIKLYDYARRKGFLLTIFTSLADLPTEVFEKFVREPPFSIEMTLNAATEKTYEKISRVKGSFKNIVRNIDKIVSAKLPLKIKTMLTTENFHEIDKLEKLVNSFGIGFKPSTLLFARLNGDTVPCRYRLPIEETVKLEGLYEESECGIKSDANSIFRCPVGTWQYHVNPLGRMHLCSCIRYPSFDILNGNVSKGVKFLSDFVRRKRFNTDSKCKDCRLWLTCNWCSGKAYLETGEWEEPIPYFCELAHRQTQLTR